MSRGVNNGWDFIKVGKIYQYKEGGWIAMVKVIEDKSTDKMYEFELQVEKSNWPLPGPPEKFTLTHNKEFNGIYSDMSQLYEEEEYFCNYKWERE